MTIYRPQKTTGRQPVIGIVARLRDGQIRLVNGVLEVSRAGSGSASCCLPYGTLKSRTAF